MRHTLTIASRELRSLFVSPVAYVVLTLWSVIAGTFFLASLIGFQEQQIQLQQYQMLDRLEQMKGELTKVQLDEPPEAHLPRGEYIRLMGDLMVVALQTGLTRVATFMVGPERWDTPFLYESLFDKPRSHHQMSHNQGKFLEDLLRVDRFHMEQFAYLVEKMSGIEEANGATLLDNTLFTYGSGLGDGATHQYTELPIIVAGGAGGQVKGDRHVQVAEGTPLANLWLTQARLLGAKLPRFADSTGEIGGLREV